MQSMDHAPQDAYGARLQRLGTGMTRQQIQEATQRSGRRNLILKTSRDQCLTTVPPIGHETFNMGEGVEQFPSLRHGLAPKAPATIKPIPARKAALGRKLSRKESLRSLKESPPRRRSMLVRRAWPTYSDIDAIINPCKLDSSLQYGGRYF